VYQLLHVELLLTGCIGNMPGGINRIVTTLIPKRGRIGMGNLLVVE